MKMKKTGVYGLLALFVLVCVIIGISLWNRNMGADNNIQVSIEGKDTSGLENSSGKILLSFWVPLESWASPAIKSYDDCEVFREVEKITGIGIRWIHPTIGQEVEQFSLMIASDELPDIIQQANRYKGGLSKGIKDGVYLRLNEQIEKNAPNYKWIRSMDPAISKGTVDDDGNICAFYGLSSYEEWTWWGPLLRADWMEELQLKAPETMEEWHDVLTAFKNKKEAEAPLLFPSNGLDWSSVFMSAYDAYSGMFYRDGKVQFGPIQPGMKLYLAEMRKWYIEGLIDRFFAARDWNQWQQMAFSGRAGAFLQSAETMSGILEPHGIGITAALYPVVKQGDSVHMRWKGTKVLGFETAITTACRYPEDAVRFLDFGYSQKGWELYNYGMEGRTHMKDSDGKPKFWEGSIVYHDPDGIPTYNALWRYKLHWGPFLRDEHNANPMLVRDKKAQQIRKFWTETQDGAYWMPPAALLPEEGAREAAVSTQIGTYINEMVVKFIMGVEPVEKFDNYVEQIQKMGLAQMLDMWQKAVERYEKR
jgi:putative aldouronate transport system substrate-binding protein